MCKIWGVEVEYSLHQPVLIRSARQSGIITGMQINTAYNQIFYLVEFTYGSVFIHDVTECGQQLDTGSYDHEEGWFTPDELAP